MLTKEKKLRILREVLKRLRNDRIKYHFLGYNNLNGLCDLLLIALSGEKGFKIVGVLPCIQEYIPEFKPPKGVRPNGHWWDLDDFRSRIRYVKKLIKEIKNE